MSNRPKLKQIREEMSKITTRQPTEQQIKELGELFRKNDDEKRSDQQKEEQKPMRKIAKSPEKDL